MIFAVNYSRPAAQLLKRGKIHFDRFKCPAWPDLVKEAQALLPVYVHFPLKIGWGKGTALDNETKAPVDWTKIENFMSQTDTPMVNLHFAPFQEGEYALPAGLSESQANELVAERAIRDVQAVVQRFGPERVILENESPGLQDHPLRAVYLPETIRRVIETAACGFLFDLSHARLSAQMLGIDAQEYIRALPVERIREIHLTGIQMFDEAWIERLRKDPDSLAWIPRLAGRRMDHLPLTEEDWQATEWAMEQVRAGKWGAPWTITCEYGGIGPLWQPITLPETLAVQIPRLYNLVLACQPDPNA